MQTFLIAVVSVAFVLGFMITIHELGHHLVAKFFKVRVDTFSIGFGKRLLGFHMGGTDYRISALPFGGYVKMAGENPMEPRTGDPGEFMSHPRWQRIIIAFAGPAMNIAFAIAVLTAVFMVRYEHDPISDKPAVIGIIDPDSPASRAGLQVGDRIVRIEGQHDPTWEDVSMAMVLNSQAPISLAVQRDSKTFTASIHPEIREANELPYTGLFADDPSIVVKVEPDMPAAKAGILEGDAIVAINGQEMHSLDDIPQYTKAHGDKPMTLGIVRRGAPLNIMVVPALAEAKGNKVYRMGITTSHPIKVDQLPFGRALKLSLQTNRKMSFLILEMVQKLLQRKVSLKQVDGPIGMARATGDAASQKGWWPLAQLMALISLNLGIFNLLPIPILDGGLILLTCVEGVIRRDINQRMKERIYQTAFVFLILFAVTVVFNDVTKIPAVTKLLH